MSSPPARLLRQAAAPVLEVRGCVGLRALLGGGGARWRLPVCWASPRGQTGLRGRCAPSPGAGAERRGGGAAVGGFVCSWVGGSGSFGSHAANGEERLRSDPASEGAGPTAEAGGGRGEGGPGGSAPRGEAGVAGREVAGARGPRCRTRRARPPQSRARCARAKRRGPDPGPALGRVWLPSRLRHGRLAAPCFDFVSQQNVWRCVLIWRRETQRPVSAWHSNFESCRGLPLPPYPTNETSRQLSFSL